jgi:hypothetical protein
MNKEWNDINLPVNPWENKKRRQEQAAEKKAAQEQGKADAQAEADAYNEKFNPELTDPAWAHGDDARAKESPDKAVIGDTILLTVKTKGIVPGAGIDCFIRDQSVDAPWKTERKLRGRVADDDTVSIEWEIDKNENDGESPDLTFWFEDKDVNKPAKSQEAKISLAARTTVNFIEFPDTLYHEGCAIPMYDESGILLGALESAFSHGKENSSSKLMACGHAAKSDGGVYPALDVSASRAKALKALLSGDESAWSDIAQDFSCAKDIQRFLATAAVLLGWDCSPGKIDGAIGPKSKAAIKKYKSAFNKKFSASLADSDAPDGEFFGSMGTLIRSQVQESYKSATGEESLPDLAWLESCDGVYGCGTSFAPEQVQSKTGRRVELYFIPSEAKPAFTEHADDKTPVTTGECPLYGTMYEREPVEPGVSDARVTPVVKKIEITSSSSHFAPSAEKCTIKYKVDAPEINPNDKGTIEIKDSDGTVIFKKEDLTLDATKESTFEWDGKTSSGASVDIAKAPVKIQLSVTGSPKVVSGVKEVKVEVHSIEFQIPSLDASNRIIMNDPSASIDITAVVKLKKSDGTAAAADIPMDVKFTFSDPGSNNTEQLKSYKYEATPKYLGKKGDANAVFWKAHPDCTASSADGFKSSCVVKTITASGSPKLGMAVITFLPSGVGGDDYKIKASVFSAGSNAVLQEKETTAFTVWREVNFSNIREMQGTNHVSSNATSAIISPYFDPAKVNYIAGGATALAATYSVDYIGLWNSATTSQSSWATVKAKLPAETPTAQELTDANYSGTDPAKVTKRTQAQNAIVGKAQAWVNRIDQGRETGMNTWQTSAAIPNNSIVGIKKFHPKYSNTADTVTSEWNLYGSGTPAWLRVTAFSGNYTNLDPDQIWVNGGEWGGLSVGNGVFLVPDYVAGVIVKVVCHEAGHATKSFFKRDDFGPSLDHSASNAGIMYFDTSGGNNFTDREKKILRGVVP